MIIFDLACRHDHCFEGWFQSGEDFQQQCARHLVACPTCGSAEVRRVPSPVHLNKASKAVRLSPEAATTERPAMPSRLAEMPSYQELVALLLASCEDVGERFAEEARKIHYLDAPDRPIRGQTTAEEYEALRDEGIEVLCLPRPKIGDLH